MLRYVAASSRILTVVPPAAPFNRDFAKLQRPFSPFPMKLSSPSIPILSTADSSGSGYLSSEEESEHHWDFTDNAIGEDDGDSPWEGAVLYTRNAAISHLEYTTTLERLGLHKVSSEFSKKRASEMGLRLVNLKKDCPTGTPVQISVDVTRRKHRLRLDGIIRTVLSLNCNSCGDPAAEAVYSEFSLLLHNEPIQESETIDMDFLSGNPKQKSVETEDESINEDDRLYFPPHEKSIDISKNIRDLVHVEIIINALCDPKCKGLCLKCGTNLNISKCDCKNQKVEEKSYGPLGDLRKRMEHA